MTAKENVYTALLKAQAAITPAENRSGRELMICPTLTNVAPRLLR